MSELRMSVVLGALLLASCVGTEIGNPPTPSDAQVSIDMLAVEESETTVPIALTVNADIEVTRAVLLVGDLRFREASTCSDRGAARTDGFVSELLEPDVEVENLELPVGSYCGVDVRPRRGGEDGFAAELPELDGLTAYAEGTYQGTPFVIRHESDDEIEFQGSFELPPGDQVIFLAVDMLGWFDNIDLGTADRDANGRIVIGVGGSFGADFKRNFEASVSVALDANGDRMLTPEDEEHEDDEEDDL